MPVQYFVGQDSQDREQAPEYSHETLAVIDIIKRIYAAFHHHPNLYALIANLHKRAAMADLVVITERGLGVVELKHYFGSISLRGTEWYAGPQAIPGNPVVDYRNPHEQVQLYTETLRAQLKDPRNFGKVRGVSTPWLPGTLLEWERFQFGTAVCFTNPEAKFDRFPFWHYQKSPKNPHIKAWEQFTLLTPAELPNWVAALRFEVGKGRAGHFEPYQLAPQQILRIVTEFVRCD